MRTLTFCVLLLASCSSCLAESSAPRTKPAEVALSSGGTITGLVTEWPANIFFDNGSFPMTYSKDQVKAIRYLDGDEATAVVRDVKKHRAETRALPERQETKEEREARLQRQVQRA
jgi:hypothetical protein